MAPPDAGVSNVNTTIQTFKIQTTIDSINRLMPQLREAMKNAKPVDYNHGINHGPYVEVAEGTEHGRIGEATFRTVAYTPNIAGDPSLSCTVRKFGGNEGWTCKFVNRQHSGWNKGPGESDLYSTELVDNEADGFPPAPYNGPNDSVTIGGITFLMQPGVGGNRPWGLFTPSAMGLVLAIDALRSDQETCRRFKEKSSPTAQIPPWCTNIDNVNPLCEGKKNSLEIERFIADKVLAFVFLDILSHYVATITSAITFMRGKK